MIVVSNSGPLIALAKIGKLGILKELFGKIFVLNAVWVEVVVRGKNKPGAKELSSADWIEVKNVKDSLSVEILKKEIEIGEAEAIVLAKEINADLLLLDEKIPRIIAKSIGIEVIGTLAILAVAKKKGIINEDFNSLIRELRGKGVWFSDRVIGELKNKWDN